MPEVPSGTHTPLPARNRLSDGGSLFASLFVEPKLSVFFFM